MFDGVTEVLPEANIGSIQVPSAPVLYEDHKTNSTANRETSVASHSTAFTAPPNVAIPVTQPSASTKISPFVAYQAWHGYVQNVDRESRTFTARLFDARNSNIDEMAEFDFADLSPEQIATLDIGQVFDWSIGRTLQGRTIVKGAYLVFRRSKFGQEEIAKAELAASELFASFPAPLKPDIGTSNATEFRASKPDDLLAGSW